MMLEGISLSDVCIPTTKTRTSSRKASYVGSYTDGGAMTQDYEEAAEEDDTETDEEDAAEEDDAETDEEGAAKEDAGTQKKKISSIFISQKGKVESNSDAIPVFNNVRKCMKSVWYLKCRCAI